LFEGKNHLNNSGELRLIVLTIIISDNIIFLRRVEVGTNLAFSAGKNGKVYMVEKSKINGGI
jgi:hypothetical protein